jgi:hypothetical protein
MYSRNRTACGISDQQRKAIGNLHSQRNAFNCRGERVPFGFIPFERIILYYIHTIGMDLTQGREARVLKIQRCQKSSSVFADLFNGIPWGIVEIQGSVSSTGSSFAGGKTMAKAGNALQSCAAVIAYSLEFSKNKSTLPHVRNSAAWRPCMSTRIRSDR